MGGMASRSGGESGVQDRSPLQSATHTATGPDDTTLHDTDIGEGEHSLPTDPRSPTADIVRTPLRAQPHPITAAMVADLSASAARSRSQDVGRLVDTTPPAGDNEPSHEDGVTSHAPGNPPERRSVLRSIASAPVFLPSGVGTSVKYSPVGGDSADETGLTDSGDPGDSTSKRRSFPKFSLLLKSTDRTSHYSQMKTDDG